MHERKAISCDLHDHLELACLRRYDVELTLLNGKRVTGRAVTTRTGADKVEYLCLASDGAGIDVPTGDIARLIVTTADAMFDDLNFTEE